MELNQSQLIFITILILCFAAIVYGMIFGPSGFIRKAQEAEAKRLETRTTIGGGIEVIDDFLELAQVYAKLGRLSDAEAAMRKALALAEFEYGKKNPLLKPVLKKYAKILNKCNRSVEARNMLKRAGELGKK